MDPVQEIKNRLSIEEVVADYVQLKKAGRNFKGLCPFHHEKTPSFIVSPEKQLAYCFGCQKGGDIFKFIQEIENVEFKEALELLARKAGVELTPLPQANKSLKSRLFEMHELATDFYVANLIRPDQESVRNYLQERGLQELTINKFRLGYAPAAWDHLSQRLLKAGFNQEEIVSSGLALWRENKNDGIYDRFRQRIMFPLCNGQGQVLGFSGRILGQGEPKYLNSPESLIFHKKDFLYAFNFAKQPIKEKNAVIFTEGQMDTLMCHQAGFTNTVATSGTALTEQHLLLVKRLTRNLILALDTDQAGVNATNRAIELALGEDFEIRIFVPEHGKDPSEIIAKDPSLFEQALTKVISWFEFQFQVVFRENKLSDPQQKRQVAEQLFTFLKKIPSQLDLEHYLKALAKKLQVSLDALSADFKRLGRKSSFRSDTTPVAHAKPTYQRSELLLGLLINNPKELAYAIGALEDFQNLGSDLEEAFLSLKNYYTTNTPHFVLSDFLSTLKSPELKQRIELLALYTEQSYQDFEETEIHKEVKSLLQKLKDETKLRLLKALAQQIKDAENTGDQALINSLLAKQRDLLK